MGAKMALMWVDLMGDWRQQTDEEMGDCESVSDSR